MIELIKPKSDFSRNVLTLMTGTAIAQAIPIAITPILTRLYTPEDFGLLALFVSITTILGSIASGRYELAILLPEKDEDAINIAALGLLIAGCLSLLVLVVVFIFNTEITNILGNKEIGSWLYFVPLVVLMTGLFNILNYLNVRKKLYKDIAKANVYKATGMTSVQLGVGFMKSGATGLISGQIVSRILANYRLAKNTRENYHFKEVNKKDMFRLASRYKDFPKFSMWAIFANTLAYSLTNILISIYYSVSTLGFYSMSQKILAMPAALVGTSIGQVYFQEATKEKQATGLAINTFNKTSKKLFIISGMFFLPLFFILPAVFEFVLGKPWRVSGEYAQVMLPLVSMQFISAALSNTNNIFEKQKIALAWQTGLLLLSITILLFSAYLGFGFKEFVTVFSIVLFLYYLLLFFILRKVARAEL